MKSKELREKFLEYFEKRGHRIVPSSSLIPKDNTVLLTTAGMQQFVPYLSGEKDVLGDFSNKHLCSSQKCFRAVDIDEVGDDTHHTFFEMLGNWSIGTNNNGEYFKEGAIKFALDFFVGELGLEKDKLHITIFEGNNDIPKDEEAKRIWLENGILEDKIKEMGMEDNFWGPTANIGPCGPSSEIYYNGVEIWNLVFMEYNKKSDGTFEKLSQTNIDTGVGFERLLTLLNNVDSAYETDLFEPIIKELEKLSDKKYKDNQKNFRIIVDHIRSSVFLIADGIVPSNTEKGYILRRILRRAIRFGKLLNLDKSFLIDLAKVVIKEYKEIYPELENDNILNIIKDEQEKFEKTLENGLKQFEKLEKITGDDAFNLYQSYGFPFELTQELAKEKGINVDENAFKDAFEKHQDISRTGADKKFKGGLADDSEQVTKYHTATHLLLSALREVLDKDVQQKGSNITAERLRFDFNHSAKLTEEEVKKVEDLVNQKIKEDLEVEFEEIPLDQARKEGAVGVFGEKYGDVVKVYTINNFSKEICGGPHVERTSELGQFKITKQKSPGAGMRRIRAILE